MIIEQPAHRQYSAPAADAGRRRLQVIIVGAGFGGLTAVRALKRATVDITLVDRRNHHLSQPLLYQVAAPVARRDRLADPPPLSTPAQCSGSAR